MGNGQPQVDFMIFYPHYNSRACLTGKRKLVHNLYIQQKQAKRYASSACFCFQIQPDCSESIAILYYRSVSDLETCEQKRISLVVSRKSSDENNYLI